jgi:AAA15 family ATPase/GTPase
MGNDKHFIERIDMRLISFSVANYRSFFNEQTIVFGASGNVDAILGANGSGKTNLFRALTYYRNFILNSTNYIGQTMPYDPFILREGAGEIPTVFSATFKSETREYTYKFSILKGKVQDEILKEKTLKTIFSRKTMKNGDYKNNGFDAELLRETLDNSLILTQAQNKKNKYAIEIFKCLEQLKLISGTQPVGETAKRILESNDFKTKVLDFLRRSDLFIQDVAVREVKMPEEMLKGLPIKDEFVDKINRTGYEITTIHLVRNDKGGKVVKLMPLSMGYHESRGTSRIFELAYPLIDTLETGNVLYIDEFEASLHPTECKFIISLFTSKDNVKNAQLIVNTHSTQIIDQINRNNIHLIGKNNGEESILGYIPKDIRTDDPNVEKKYMKGFFGAVPNVQW